MALDDPDRTEAARPEEAFFRHRFSWGVAFAGAAVATATIFFLLSLGSGVGLSLVSARGAAEPAFLTLGAIYFLAAQAFGFAVGGHLAGRLIGPAPETAKEEEFRAGAHGLVVWAIGVVATAILVLMSGWVAAGATVTGATLSSLTSGTNAITSVSPATAGYWTDLLFRPSAAVQHASLAGVQFAQAETGEQNDATPEGQLMQQQQMEQPPMAQSPNAPAPAQPATPPSSPTSVPPTETAPVPAPAGAETQPITPRRSPLTIIQGPSESLSPPPAQPRNVAADKAEVARILQVGLADGSRLQSYDKQRIADLIAADAGLGMNEAMRRVDNAEARIHDDQIRKAEAARKAARNASLWIALALLFGAIVSTMAAVSARWTDDRITFGPRRGEPG